MKRFQSKNREAGNEIRSRRTTRDVRSGGYRGRCEARRASLIIGAESTLEEIDQAAGVRTA